MASNGIAGEYYVAAELTNRGMIATITGKNTKDIDIVTVNPENGKTLLIQVKEKSKANNSDEWKMSGEYKQNQIDMNIWYVFVDLAAIKYYIISAAELFPKMQARRDAYNHGFKKNGQPRKPDPCLYFNRKLDCTDSNGNPKENNWDELPIF